MGFGKDGKGEIITDFDVVTLGTLADNTALKQDNPLVIGDDFRVIKLELAADWRAVATGDGPVALYFADDEMSTAEIQEAVDANGPLNRNDRERMEQATRPVFLLGIFPEFKTGHPTLLHGAEGQVGTINKTIRWTFSNPEGWTIVAINRTGGALTTGGIISLSAKFFGVWVT